MTRLSPAMLTMIALAAALPGLIGLTAPATVAEPTPAAFTKIQLTDKFHAETAGIGDIDRDGHVDAIYGPFWYAGPDFKTRHQIHSPEDFDPNVYSNNFMTSIADIDGDGWLDVLTNVWPGKEVVWFRNPGKDGVTAGGDWQRHLVHPTVDNESPTLADVTGDGKPELVFHTGGILGFARPSEPTATDRWLFTPCSEPAKWGQYQHGLGVGDVNGDGRADLLLAEGWWEQPATLSGETLPRENVPRELWKKHPVAFGKGGAQMHTYDVDGDGDMDVITSLVAHGYGLSWFEQLKKEGEIDFVEHAILPATAEGSLDGVQFSQPHAVQVVDVNGDGLKDIITGKRFWAHGPKGDPDPAGTPVLYWLELVRDPAKTGAEGLKYLPHRIDDASGVGTQFAVGDLNADGRVDIVIGNKKGGFVFRSAAAAN